MVHAPAGYRATLPWPDSKDTVRRGNVRGGHLGKGNGLTVAGKFILFSRPGRSAQLFRAHVGDMMKVLGKLQKKAGRPMPRQVLDVHGGMGSLAAVLDERGMQTLVMGGKHKSGDPIQIAAERGFPAVLGVVKDKRAPFPQNAFDMIHVRGAFQPGWAHQDTNSTARELDRLLRPGGVLFDTNKAWRQRAAGHTGAIEYRRNFLEVAKRMCWKPLMFVDDLNGKIETGMFRKPHDAAGMGPGCATHNEVYDGVCLAPESKGIIWNSDIPACYPHQPLVPYAHGTWPLSLTEGPVRPPSPSTPPADYLRELAQGLDDWKAIVRDLHNVFKLGILGDAAVHSILDVHAGRGSFAAALADLKSTAWVMNVVPTAAETDTLPAILDRGLVGIYHDWCLDFPAYPRAFDLVHVSSEAIKLNHGCSFGEVMLELDRLLKPHGHALIQSDVHTVIGLEDVLIHLGWVRFRETMIPYGRQYHVTQHWKKGADSV